MARATGETWHYRLHPMRAIREIRRIRREPDDLVGPARFFLWMGGHDDGRTHQRALRDAGACRVLSERRPLPRQVYHFQELLDLPEGSFGRAYAEHLRREELDPLKIQSSTELAYAEFEASELHEFVRVRTRDAHDLVHALTGYGTDYLGETAAVAFTFGNCGNRGYLGLALTGLLGLLAMGQLRALRFIWDGYRRGRRARLLWGADWEPLLPRPLDEVRGLLAVEPVPPYEPVDYDAFYRTPASA